MKIIKIKKFKIIKGNNQNIFKMYKYGSYCNKVDVKIIMKNDTTKNKIDKIYKKL